MASWGEFAESEPELAAYGAVRIEGMVAYLATVRADGRPRVHPVTPIIGEGRLFLFMEPASPKGRDLRRNGAYALHSSVADTNGSNGEFIVKGGAALVDDPAVRALAVRSARYTPADRYILFELSVDGAGSTVYEGGSAVRRRWGRP